MSGDGYWNTVDNVLDDLARFNGLRQNNIPEEYIVRGNKAPRRPRTTDEDTKLQIEMLYGRQGSGDGSTDYTYSNPPDLDGIQSMLQMVRTIEEEQDQEKKTIRGKHGSYIDISDKPKTKFVISKLDPTVREFVPKIVQDEQLISCENSIPRDDVEENFTPRVKKNSTAKNNVKKKSTPTDLAKDNLTPRDAVADNSLPIDVEAEERQKKEAELKSRILRSSIADTVVAKRDRNAAISALMKLKAASASPNTSSNNTQSSSPCPVQENIQTPTSSNPQAQLVLYPPAYFETSTRLNENIKDKSESLKISKSEENDTQNLAINITPVAKPTSPSNKVIVNPDVEESIKKVENWLDAPKKQERVYPNLSPITFKRKQCSTPSSISESKPKPTPSVPHYIPSKGADELFKKYSEKAKIIEEQKMDIWTKLERDLKEKDKQILKKRQLEKEQNEIEQLFNADSVSELVSSVQY